MDRRMTRLTDRQREVLTIVEAHILSRGYPPTFRELADSLKIQSTNGITDHLRALARKGYIRRVKSQSRGIVLLRSGSGTGAPPPSVELAPKSDVRVERAMPVARALAELMPAGTAEGALVSRLISILGEEAA